MRVRVVGFPRDPPGEELAAAEGGEVIGVGTAGRTEILSIRPFRRSVGVDVGSAVGGAGSGGKTR